MKKKIVCLGLAVVLAAAVCGCGSSNKSLEKKAEETTVESSESVEEETTEEETTEEAVEEVQEAEEPVEEEVVTGKAVVDIPEGFKEYLAPSGIYVTSKYPEDGTNIYILTTPLYGDFPDEAGYKAKINDNISSQVGEKVEINLIEYGETTVEGCDAIRAVYTYSHDGMNFKRLEYTVNTDITTVIAYTQEGDADWMDVFEESALTMRIE